MEKTKYIVVNGKPVSIEVEEGKMVSINEQASSPKITKLSGREYEIVLNGKTIRGEVLKLKQNTCQILVNGNTYTFNIETEKSFKRAQKLAETMKETKLRLLAPLPGVICEVQVEKEQPVKKGDTLLILEAMKMQNEILSPMEGIITEISIKEGENVLKDQVLIEITPIS